MSSEFGKPKLATFFRKINTFLSFFKIMNINNFTENAVVLLTRRWKVV